MGRTLSLLSVLMIAGLAAGQEDADALELEKLKLARVAAEAKLKLGDILRERGDLDGARREYLEAARLVQQALDRRPAAPVAREKVIRAPVRGDAPVKSSDAIDLGLRWLASNQRVGRDEDGRWDCDAVESPGGSLYDVGVTGLALLAFLGAGHTDRGGGDQNPYAANVRDGLRFLLASQDEEGCVGTRSSQHFIYNHAIATLAICEAYALTRNPRYKATAQAGLNFIAKARNPYMAWRYEPRGGDNDTSVTSWCVMALRSGKNAGLNVDPDAFDGARAWLDKMTEPEFGQIGYNLRGGSPARPEGLQDRFPPDRSRSLTAAGLFTRLLIGDKRTETNAKSARLCLEVLPTWEPKRGSTDMYYWYFGTLAMFRMGGDYWAKWNAALREALLRNQYGADSGPRAGSWDPVGPWGQDGGRIYATALLTMCLEISDRYERVFGTG